MLIFVTMSLIASMILDVRSSTQKVRSRRAKWSCYYRFRQRPSFFPMTFSCSNTWPGRCLWLRVPPCDFSVSTAAARRHGAHLKIINPHLPPAHAPSADRRAAGDLWVGGGLDVSDEVQSGANMAPFTTQATGRARSQPFHPPA